jgi:flagellar biosynthetic protein FliQ
MTPDMVVALARDSGMLVLMVGGPILGAGLVTGLAVSVLQAVTQIQEQTLSFIPKLIVTFLVLGFMGNWMIGQLLTYTVGLFSNLALYAH